VLRCGRLDTCGGKGEAIQGARTAEAMSAATSSLTSRPRDRALQPWMTVISVYVALLTPATCDLGEYLRCKKYRVSADVLWRVFPCFLTEHIAVWARASLFRRFPDTDVCETGSVKIW